MVLGDPVPQVARLLGVPGQVEGVAQRLRRGAAGSNRRQVEDRQRNRLVRHGPLPCCVRPRSRDARLLLQHSQVPDSYPPTGHTDSRRGTLIGVKAWQYGRVGSDGSDGSEGVEAVKRQCAGRPLLGTRQGRRQARGLLAACVVVTLAIGVAFAHQSTADVVDRVLDDPVIRLLGGHPTALHWMEFPGTQVPALVLSLAMAAACLVARRLNGVVLSLTAVFVATRVDEWVLKPLFHRTYLGALSYPSGHTTSVVTITACYVVLFLLPPRAARRRARPWALAGLAALLALLVVTALGVIGLRWHYLTDVVGGAAVGVAAVCALCLLLDAAWRRLGATDASRRKARPA
jgi:membrane-associated phospholipid phosphatase